MPLSSSLRKKSILYCILHSSNALALFLLFPDNLKLKRPFSVTGSALTFPAKRVLTAFNGSLSLLAFSYRRLNSSAPSLKRFKPTLMFSIFSLLFFFSASLNLSFFSSSSRAAMPASAPACSVSIILSRLFMMSPMNDCALPYISLARLSNNPRRTLYHVRQLSCESVSPCFVSQSS